MSQKLEFGIPTMQLPTTPAESIMLAVKEIKDRAPGPPNNYRYWSVESLLNEASALMDRCFDLKRYLDELLVHEANQSLQLQQEKDADELSEMEKAASLDEHPFNLAINNLYNLQHLTASESIAGLPIRKGRDVDNPNLPNSIDQQMNAGRKLNDVDDGQTKNKSPSTWTGLGIVGQAMASAVEYGLRVKTLENEKNFEFDASTRRSTVRKRASELRASRRNMATNGALNYSSRISKLAFEIVGPYLIDIEQRCLKAREGLKIIYGWDVEPVPDLNLDAVESLCGWIRRRISELARFGHLDQGFTITISLAQLKIPLNLNTPLSFIIPDSYFASHSYCRLRSIAAFVEPTEGAGLFKVQVNVPKFAEYTDANGAPLGPPVDQSDVPTCSLGRVTSRLSSRTPEAGGTISMINAAPKSSRNVTGVHESMWHVKIEKIFGASDLLTDVQLELGLVGQPRAKSF